jgi:hypothetical protein
VLAAPQLIGTQMQKQVVKGTILSSWMVFGDEHLVVSAIQFVMVEGRRYTANIGRMRFYNHDYRD